MKTNESATVAIGANQRAVPPLPGGGSWTFNESIWQWEDNAPRNAAANNTTDQEQ